MDYQQITTRVDAVLRSGGFPSDEPLDSVRLISESTAHEIPDYMLGTYSSVLANFGQWDRAEAVARKIHHNPNEMGVALAVIAQGMAAADLLDRAESVALSIPNSSAFTGAMVEKATAILAIASKHLAEGSSDRPEKLLAEAEKTVRCLSYANHLLVSLLGDLASALYRIGQVQPALKLWDESTAVAGESIRAYREGGAPDVDSWKSLSIIAEDLFSIGETARAERALALIDNDDWRERTLRRLKRI